MIFITRYGGTDLRRLQQEDPEFKGARATQTLAQNTKQKKTPFFKKCYSMSLTT
jgi:hypothetical protein